MYISPKFFKWRLPSFAAPRGIGGEVRTRGSLIKLSFKFTFVNSISGKLAIMQCILSIYSIFRLSTWCFYKKSCLGHTWRWKEGFVLLWPPPLIRVGQLASTSDLRARRCSKGAVKYIFTTVCISDKAESWWSGMPPPPPPLYSRLARDKLLSV